MVQRGQTMLLVDRSGRQVLRYGDLHAVDAGGRVLGTRLVAAHRAILLTIDDRLARYPVRVDPYIQGTELLASDTTNTYYFGADAAMSGDGNAASFGAYNSDVNGVRAAGTAYVFVRSSGGSSWTLQQKLTASDGASGDGFGISVALSGNGNIALVEASGRTANGGSGAGTVYVFVRPSGGITWTQQQEVIATDTAYPDAFGRSVALSSDGLVALIGTPGKTVNAIGFVGAAYVFKRPAAGTTFSQQQKLIASDGAYTDVFGSDVVLSGDGATALITSDAKTVKGINGAGAAYIFVRSTGGSSWNQQQVFNASDATAGECFGCTAALSTDGTTALVGAPDQTVGGAPSAGAAYAFTRPSGGTVWTERQELTASDAAA